VGGGRAVESQVVEEATWRCLAAASSQAARVVWSTGQAEGGSLEVELEVGFSAIVILDAVVYVAVPRIVFSWPPGPYTPPSTTTMATHIQQRISVLSPPTLGQLQKSSRIYTIN